MVSYGSTLEKTFPHNNSIGYLINIYWWCN